jgi:cytochrome c-type biogenesis protein CcmH
VTGWIVLIALFAASLLGLRLLGMRGAMLQITAAALLLGSAGYALHGSPGLDGSPRSARAEEPPIPLTRIRHAFFGQFTSAETWFRVSEALASRGKTRDAATVFKTAVRRNPEDVALWVGLGNALVDHSREITPASQFAYVRAGELAPGHPAPAFFMGLALARSGQRDAALLLWREVLENAPADAEWRGFVEGIIEVTQAEAERPR